MIRLERGRFVVDGKPAFVFSGEIHYFRLEPARWPLHLRAAKAAGLDTVSSYVPWLWHEPERGRFDFTGRTHPKRDLERWLDLVAASGLRFIARVGPVSNAEMVNEGVPSWLLRGHPEVFVRGREITNLPHTTLLAYHNPTFLEHVGRWYDALLPRVAARQHPRGPIVLVQLCNEIGMVHWLQKAADYSPGTERMFREFLAERHGGDIAGLNAAWGTAHAGFDQVTQPPGGDDRQAPRMLWDWMAFYRHYYARYFAVLEARARAHGIALPVLANIPQFYDYDVRGRGVFAPMTTMMFRDFAAHSRDLVLGGAYQMRRLDYENFHDIALTTEVVKLVSAPGAPVLCAELQTGIMRDRPRLYPQDVELNLKTSVAHGLNAVNAYMFSGGRNEPGMGAFGSYHEWQAPVAADGRKRPHYAALRDFGRQMRSFGAALADTEKACDVVLGFYPPYWNTEYLSGPRVEAWEWKKHHLFYDGLGRLLQLANLNSRFLDLERASQDELNALPALFVFTLEFMEEAVQRKLVAYVAAGGRLLLNPDLPVLDLGLEPCTVLAEALGLAVKGKKTRDLAFTLGKRDYVAQGEIVRLEPGGGTVVARTTEGDACAVRARHGRGQALVLGMGLNHMFDYEVDLVRGFAAGLGVKPAVETDGGLQLCLRRNDRHGFLFVANFHDVPQAGRVRLVLPGEKRPVTLPARGRIALGRRRGYVLPLNLRLANGDVLRYATAEVLEAGTRAGRTRVVVTGEPGAEGEVELITRARGATLDGRRIAGSKRGGRLRVRVALSGAPQTLEVR